MASFVIRDSFQEVDKFPGAHWISPLEFTYRPCLPERFYDFSTARKDNGKQTFAENAKLIKECLVSWDVTDEKGNPLSHTDDVVLRKLPHPVIQYIVNCICSYGPDRFAQAEKN